MPMIEVRLYTLKVSGSVGFTDEDKDIEDLLLGKGGSPEDRLEVALQELHESAHDLVVEMERV